MRCCLLLLMILIMSGCAPVFVGADSKPLFAPALTETEFITADGAPVAVILALHGFNDYSTFIDAALSGYAALPARSQHGRSRRSACGGIECAGSRWPHRARRARLEQHAVVAALGACRPDASPASHCISSHRTIATC